MNKFRTMVILFFISGSIYSAGQKNIKVICNTNLPGGYMKMGVRPRFARVWKFDSLTFFANDHYIYRKRFTKLCPELYSKAPIRDIQTVGHYMWLVKKDTLEVYRFTEEKVLKRINVYRVPDPNGVCIVDNYAYVYTQDSGIYIFKIKNFSHIKKVSRYLVLGKIRALKILYPYAILIDGYGLIVLDISDIEHPREVNYLPTPGLANDLVVFKKCGYLSDSWRGLWIIDFSDPKKPEFLEHIPMGPVFIKRLRIIGDTLLVRVREEKCCYNEEEKVYRRFKIMPGCGLKRMKDIVLRGYW